MKNQSVFKLVLAGILVAVAVVASSFSIPVGVTKCLPVQHLVNVLAAVLLGPWYGVIMAFLTSLIRVALSTGSLLAFPGSMCGALLCGLAYRYTGRLVLTYLGEIIGTGFIGALLSYPIALWLMGNTSAALFGFVIPFSVSTIGGTLIAAVVIGILQKAHMLTPSGLTLHKE